jgi:hypothetical protein
MSVKDKNMDAGYLGVSRMRRERKEVAKADREQLAKLRNAERFQNEAVINERRATKAITTLQDGVSQREAEVVTIHKINNTIKKTVFIECKRASYMPFTI